MNLKIVCQKENELLELRKNLKSELKKNKYKGFEINFVAQTCKKFDLYIIISNDLEFIYKNSFNFKTKEYKHSDLIILTSNLKSANIVGCLDLTPYVYYLRSKVESIAFKIIKIGNTKRTQPIKFQ
jgi:hypothetical protein